MKPGQTQVRTRAPDDLQPVAEQVCKLVELRSPFTEHIIPTPPRIRHKNQRHRIVIGRQSTDVTIQIEGESVSRKHCTLSYHAGRNLVGRHHEASMTTYVNGVEVPANKKLLISPGNLLTLGPAVHLLAMGMKPATRQIALPPWKAYENAEHNTAILAVLVYGGLRPAQKYTGIDRAKLRRRLQATKLGIEIWRKISQPDEPDEIEIAS